MALEVRDSKNKRKLNKSKPQGESFFLFLFLSKNGI